MTVARTVAVVALLVVPVLGAVPLGAGSHTVEDTPTAAWAHTYGGAHTEKVTGLATGSDRIALVGTTYSEEQEPDLWLASIRPNGTERWNRSYGYAYADRGADVARHPNGGYVLAGQLAAGRYGEESSAGWVVRVAANGTALWNHTYPRAARTVNRSVYTNATPLPDEHPLTVHRYSFTEIVPAHGDGYLVIGSREPTFQGAFELWVVRIGPDGTERWNRTYNMPTLRPGPGVIGNAVERVPGGYVIAGTAGGCTSHPCSPDPGDGWLLKLDRDGEKAWTRTYGRSDASEEAYDLDRTSGGEYFLVGQTASENSLWVARAGPDGQERWNRTHSAEFVGAVAATDHGAVVAAPFGSTGGPWRALTLTADGDVAERLTDLPEWQGHVRAVETTADGLLIAGTVAEDGGLIQVAPETYQLSPSPTRTPTATPSETSETPTAARISEIQPATPSDTGETTRTGQPGFGFIAALGALLGWIAARSLS